MSATSYDRPSAFRIGRVFGDTFAVLGRNFVLCFGLTVIFSGIPTFFYLLWAGTQVEAAAFSSAETDPFAFSATSFLAGLVVFVVYMVLASILQAAVMRATIEDLNGQHPTFGDALSRGVASAVPIVGLSLLAYLGIGIGFMLLFIPGLYLLIRWSVAVPALVNEQRGVLDSLKRSSELTKGSRWRILGLLAILIIAVWVVQVGLELLIQPITPMVGTIIATALSALLSAVSTVILSIAVAVTYLELRYVKEGTDVKELAEIFA